MKRNREYEVSESKVSKQRTTDSEGPLDTAANWLLSWFVKPTPEALLFSAANKGDLDTVRELMASGVRLTAQDTILASENLYTAMKKHQTETAVALIAAGANITYSFEGMSLLHLAIGLRTTEIFEALISAGANIESLFKNMTPLHYAILVGATELTQKLIAAGANKETLYKNMTPLNFAIENNQPEIVEALIKGGAKADLHLAIEKGHNKIVQTFITAGANLDAIYEDMTPLHRAIRKGRTEIAQALITAGANLEAIYDNMTPLHYALQTHKTEIALALIAAGANLEAIHNKMTPLHYAIFHRQNEITQALITAGANLETIYEGMTPLHRAIRSGRTEIAQALITAGANKATQLHFLKTVKDAKLIETLLPHCEINGLPLAKLLSNPNYFNSVERRNEFINCTFPLDYLKSNNLLSPVTLAALKLLSSASAVEKYERSLTSDDENAMDNSKVARANWHFEKKVKPHFEKAVEKLVTIPHDKLALMTTLPPSGPEKNTIYVEVNDHKQLCYKRCTTQGEVIHNSLNIFLKDGPSLTTELLTKLSTLILEKITKMETIQVIENQIRELLLNIIHKQAIEDKDQPVITFINNNKDKLIKADPTVMKSSCAIFTKANLTQAAWRGYNPYAPVNGWENLLTAPTNNELVFSTRVAHQGELHAHTASEIARERAAYYYLAVMDPNDGDDSTRVTRIENFISQLADIRNAHGLDNPSCYPGTITRCAEMGAYHSVAQLPPTTKELIAEFVKVKVLATFHDEIEKLPTFAEKEALYSALVELTTLQARDVILYPERYTPDWLPLRKNFIAQIGTTEEVITEIFTNDLFPVVDKDTVLVDQALLDIASGTTSTALADFFNRHTDSVPTLADKQNANPFKDEDSAEHKLTGALLDAILRAVPQYATSMRKLHNLSGYLANKVPDLIKGIPLKNLLAGLEIVDEKFDEILQTVSSALENTGWKASALTVNPFDAKVKQMELLIRNLPPAKAAPYQKQLDSFKNKQQRFIDYLPLIQQGFQEIDIQDDCLVRLTEAFTFHLASSNEGFDHDEFCETLNEADRLFVIEHRKWLTDLAMRIQTNASTNSSNRMAI